MVTGQELQNRMNPNRRRPHEQDESSVDRQRANATVESGGEPMLAASSRPFEDDVDGQLGPDELSEPEEVAMNLEAKRHH
jgi:hypothetical protein